MHNTYCVKRFKEFYKIGDRKCGLAFKLQGAGAAQDLDLLVADVFGVGGRWAVHCHHAHDLQKVVLHHVAARVSGRHASGGMVVLGEWKGR